MFLWRILFGREDSPPAPPEEDAGRVELRYHVEHGHILSFKECLASRGESINVQLDDHGKTALHYAAYCGRVKMVNWLINQGAKIDRKDIRQLTPLHMVFPDTDYYDVNVDMTLHEIGRECREFVRYSIASALLKNGADPNSLDSRGSTPLHYALVQHSFSVMTLLMKHGAELTVFNNKGMTPLHIATHIGSLDWALTCYGNLDAQDCNGDTLLHRVMGPKEFIYFPEIVQKILQEGATVDVRNKSQSTPYDKCLQQGVACSRVGRISENCCGVFNRLNLRLHLRNKVILIKHIVQLKTAGIPVSDDISAEFNVNSMFSLEGLQELQRVCREELRRMDVTPVRGNFTLGHVFSKFLAPHYMADEKIVEILEQILNAPDLVRHFPIYAHILKHTFKKSKKRYVLITKASQSLADEDRPHSFHLLAKDQVAVEHLFQYLNEMDLENLIKSGWENI